MLSMNFIFSDFVTSTGKLLNKSSNVSYPMGHTAIVVYDVDDKTEIEKKNQEVFKKVLH